MSNSFERVKAELRALGCQTFEFDGPHGPVVAFPYKIETGSHKGEEVLVGVSFQEEGYPEYPPHWIHVSPPIDDRKGGAVETYKREEDGREWRWLAMSRPPGDIWDRLPTKHMSAYISDHLRRIWSDV